MSFTIATWNINSVRLRMPIVKQLTESHAPDVLCLQETKVDDPLFPELELRALGYEHCAFSGEKSYNGVAILSKTPLSNIHTLEHIPSHKRHIAATLESGITIHNVYVPAGGDIPDPDENSKFGEKLAFMDSLTEWASTLDTEDKVVLVGDMNIAPLEHDVWSHKQLLKVVSHTPIEVEKMDALKQAANWVDTAREFTPHEEKLYSWWSYRARDWEASNRGRRLDHIWVTPALKPSLSGVAILAEARGWEKPSDHVPVIASLNL